MATLPPMPRFTRPTNGDVVAGVSVALVAIPQSLAYAELAGLPPHIGLFATALPAITAAAFVSSRYLQTGPVALTSLLTFGALQGLAEPRTDQYLQLAALLALMVGAFRVLLGLLRMGGVAYLLSDPVLTGFTSGAAVLIIASQLPKVFDVDPDGSGVLQQAFRAVVEVGDWSWAAVGYAAAAAAVIVLGRRAHRLFPGVLVAVVVGTIVSATSGYGGSVVGDLPGGFISLHTDFPWSEAGSLLVAAAAIALVGFAEPSSIARTFAAADRQPWDANREMISQGIANVASAASGAFPVGGSFSRSSLNRLAGADTAWSGALTGVVVLAALPLVTLVADLPSAILGAIVVVAVINLIKVRELARLFRRSMPQAFVGAGTFVATLAASPRVERGVIVGVVLAIGAHLYREATVAVSSERTGDTLTIRPQGVVWYFTVPLIERLLRRELAEHVDLDVVVIDFGGIGRLDYSGGAAIERIVAEQASAGVEVRIENISPGAARAAGIHLGGSHGVPTFEGTRRRPDRSGRSRQRKG